MDTTTMRRNSDGSFTIEATFRPQGSMMDCERMIQQRVNGIGVMATAECLAGFDTDGSPIQVGTVRMTSKGKVEKLYQGPYGPSAVARHVYQSSSGGATYCPLDHEARIVRDATPRLAEIVSSKVALLKSTDACIDLDRCNGRKLARSYMQNLTADVAAILWEKEPYWSYQTPVAPVDVATISLGIDGTCLLFCEDENGYRQAMVGTIALYDSAGERLHTTYVAAAPEYGKSTFYKDMDREIRAMILRYPHARVTAVADGAEDNWKFLSQYTDDLHLDFWHVTTYVGNAAPAVIGKVAEREQWISATCHRLKHEAGAAESLLEEMLAVGQQRKLGRQVREELQKTITYFSNHKHRMDYAAYRAQNLPIGSGVTEAACKTIVKERMRGSGMKWKSHGAQVILSLRALIKSESRWDQFWSKITQFGFTALNGPRFEES